jgi:hypothetical protein
MIDANLVIKIIENQKKVYLKSFSFIFSIYFITFWIRRGYKRSKKTEKNLNDKEIKISFLKVLKRHLVRA